MSVPVLCFHTQLKTLADKQLWGNKDVSQCISWMNINTFLDRSKGPSSPAVTSEELRRSPPTGDGGDGSIPCCLSQQPILRNTLAVNTKVPLHSLFHFYLFIAF